MIITFYNLNDKSTNYIILIKKFQDSCKVKIK